MTMLPDEWLRLYGDEDERDFEVRVLKRELEIARARSNVWVNLSVAYSNLNNNAVSRKL